MFCEESEQKVTFFFFFLNFDKVFENSTPENFANILELKDMEYAQWNKRNRVWNSAYSLYK